MDCLRAGSGSGLGRRNRPRACSYALRADSLVANYVRAVSCHDEGVFKLTGQSFFKKTSIHKQVVRIATGATIRVPNAAHLKIETDTLILESRD